MGSNEGEENGEYKGSRRTTKPHLISFFFFLLLLISIAGGFVLGWWLHKYHPTNSQLWMVPFGFVLFLTPLCVCFSLSISDICIPKTDEEQANFKTNQRNASHPLDGDDSLCDPKR